MKEIKTTLNHCFFLQSNIQVHKQTDRQLFQILLKERGKEFSFKLKTLVLRFIHII